MKKKSFIILSTAVIPFFFLLSSAFSQINLDWAKYYHSDGTPNEEAKSFCYDSSGNVYVAGSGTSVYDKIIKYDPNGNLEWDLYFSNGTPTKIIYNGLDNFFVSGSNGLLKLDPQGNSVIVKSGNFVDVLKGQDNFIYAVSSVSNQIITDKYNLEGSQMWTKIKLHSQPSGSFYALRFFQGAGNKINVFGYYSYVFLGFLSTGTTYTTYDSLGGLLYDGKILVGSSKEIRDNYSNNNYFIGYSEQSIWQSEIFIWKINSGNGILDTIRYNGPGNSRDEPYDIATDDLGNVYVACKSWGVSVNYDFVILKYNSDGNLIWEYRYNGSENGYDAAEKIKLDNSGNIYASGTVTLNSHGIQIYTVKLSPEGQLLWSDKFSRYNSLKDSNYVKDLLIDNTNNIYLCGKSRDSVSRKYDFLTVKYSQPTSVVNNNEIMNKDFYLLENYPNPFNPETKIKFNLPGKSNVKINIFSSDGKSILELLNSDYSAGVHTVVWNAQGLPTGIYFISFRAGNFKEIRKAVLIK